MFTTKTNPLVGSLWTDAEQLMRNAAWEEEKWMSTDTSLVLLQTSLGRIELATLTTCVWMYQDISNSYKWFTFTTCTKIILVSTGVSLSIDFYPCLSRIIIVFFICLAMYLVCLGTRESSLKQKTSGGPQRSTWEVQHVGKILLGFPRSFWSQILSRTGRRLAFGVGVGRLGLLRIGSFWPDGACLKSRIV